MRTLPRTAISAAGLVWIGSLVVLIWWHMIWAPVMAAETVPRPEETGAAEVADTGSEGSLAGSFRDTFGTGLRARRQAVDLRHPTYGRLELDAEEPHSGVARVSSGGFMMDTPWTADCIASAEFRAPSGDTPGGGSLVVVFARVSDRHKPYESGWAFEWDMAAGRQRLWAMGELLAERAAPADPGEHTLALVARGNRLQGLLDGETVIEATSDACPEGEAGFGGRGQPAIEFTAFELERPGEGRGRIPLPVDVGAAFDRLERFDAGQEDATGRKTHHVQIAPWLDEAAIPGVHAPWYILSLSGAQVGRAEVAWDARCTPPGGEVTLDGIAFCLIDSKGSGTARVSALVGGMDAGFRVATGLQDAQSGALCTALILRASDATYPWGACYALTCDWLQGTLELIRCEAIGAPTEVSYATGVQFRHTVLGSAQLPAEEPVDSIWVACDGDRFTAGVADRQLLEAEDATYARGYVGFGATPGAAGTFRQVRMQGSP